MQNKYPSSVKDRKKTKKTAIIVILILLVIALAVTLLKSCSASETEVPDESASGTLETDPGAIEGGWDEADTDKIIASLNEKVAEGMINISMNTSPVFANGSSAGKLMIVNESINNYPQVVEITRNDTGETVYKSGGIPVGSKIEEARLNVELNAGTYECTAMFYNVDPDTGAFLGCAGAIITITVLE